MRNRNTIHVFFLVENTITKSYIRVNTFQLYKRVGITYEKR